MGKPLAPVLFNHDLNIALATDGLGHALFGSGNSIHGWEISEDSFQFKHDPIIQHFELASEVVYRQGDTVQPDSVTPEKRGGVVMHYTMPDGPQVVDAAHGVFAANANRSAASFNYEFTMVDETIQQFLASGGELHFKIDMDAGPKVHFLDLHAVYDPIHNPGGSHVVWEDNGGNIFIADDGGNSHTTANSQNLAFYKTLIDVDPHTKGVQTGAIGFAGDYHIVEQIMDPQHHLVAQNHTDLFLA